MIASRKINKKAKTKVQDLKAVELLNKIEAADRAAVPTASITPAKSVSRLTLLGIGNPYIRDDEDTTLFASDCK